jgi:hypothetical protein
MRTSCGFLLPPKTSMGSHRGARGGGAAELARFDRALRTGGTIQSPFGARTIASVTLCLVWSRLGTDYAGTKLPSNSEAVGTRLQDDERSPKPT